MKKSLLFLTLIVMLCFGLSEIAVAQSRYSANASWGDYIGYFLALYDYGRYQDGRCIDAFRANKDNGNAGEGLIYGKTYCYWKNCQGKPKGYTDEYQSKIEGNKLYLYRDGQESNVLSFERSEPNVLRDVETGERIQGVMIFTVDKYGWYRRFWIED